MRPIKDTPGIQADWNLNTLDISTSPISSRVILLFILNFFNATWRRNFIYKTSWGSI